MDTGYLIPVVSFCDILLSRVKDHVDFYCKDTSGKVAAYGIGMKKQWGIQKGLNPLFYLNQHSAILDHFVGVFNSLLANRDSYFSKQSGPNYTYGESVYYDDIPEADAKLMRVLGLTKPYEGFQSRKVGDNPTYTKRIYYDENEWRYLPNYAGLFIHFFIRSQQQHVEGRWPSGVTPEISLKNFEAKKSEINNLYWDDPLLFEYSDITYLMINSEDDLEPIQKIIQELKLTEREKIHLYSKIQIFEDLMEDI